MADKPTKSSSFLLRCSPEELQALHANARTHGFKSLNSFLLHVLQPHFHDVTKVIDPARAQQAISNLDSGKGKPLNDIINQDGDIISPPNVIIGPIVEAPLTPKVISQPTANIIPSKKYPNLCFRCSRMGLPACDACRLKYPDQQPNPIRK